MADFNDILPTGVDIRAIELVSDQHTTKTQTNSGRIQVRTHGDQNWKATITMPAMKEDDLRRVYAFLIKQKGSFGTFTIAPTNLTRVGGTQDPSESITTGGAVGDTSITTTDSDQIAVGDMINFSGPAGHTKAYMVTEVSGQTLSFQPKLLQAVTSSHTVESRTNFEMKVRLSEDEFTYSLDETGYGFIEFKIVEVI